MGSRKRPAPSIESRNNCVPQPEEIGDDDMRITFMRSNPFQPRLSQADTCIMVDVQSRDIRDLETKPELLTPPDQIRPWVREWPKDLKLNPSMLMARLPKAK